MIIYMNFIQKLFVSITQLRYFATYKTISEEILESDMCRLMWIYLRCSFIVR